MWTTFAIFLSVIGWAYAIGSMLALVQDRAFRRALARRRFATKVRHMSEPFLVLVGYGNATKRLARSLDEMGRRFVLIDDDESRVAAVDLDSYHADTPALLANARDTHALVLAGVTHQRCEGVLALTGDDETNLDVTMTTALLRPGLPVIARTSSRQVTERMRDVGAWEVVNPLDRFGDHLRILLRSPAAYQLMVWLTSAPGTPLPPRRNPPRRGRWVVCGSGRFGRELTADLEAEGLEVTPVRGGEAAGDRMSDDIDLVSVASTHLETAAGFVAATESDMTNLWLLEATREAGGVFRVALQNRAGNAQLYRSTGVDFVAMPAELVMHEVIARLANPALMRFLPQVPHKGEAWAAALVDRLVEDCGRGTPDLWTVVVDDRDAPAVTEWLDAGALAVGDLRRNPTAREQTLGMVPLLLLRGDTGIAAPSDEELLQRGDTLLVAAGHSARRALESTLTHHPTAVYVVEGRFEPSSWVWRRLLRHQDRKIREGTRA
jgi:Trk K+ transport system NAD-binding subunit